MLHFGNLLLHEGIHLPHLLIRSLAQRLIAIFEDVKTLDLVIDFEHSGVKLYVQGVP